MSCGAGKGYISIPSNTPYSRTIIVVKSEISSQPMLHLLPNRRSRNHLMRAFIFWMPCKDPV
jgi:hypothetical protein